MAEGEAGKNQCIVECHKRFYEEERETLITPMFFEILAEMCTMWADQQRLLSMTTPRNFVRWLQ
jgi:hypothetical protein